MFASISTKRLSSGIARPLRVVGMAALAAAVVAAACGKIEDVTGSGDDDNEDYTITVSLAASSTPPSSNLGFTVTAKDKDGVAAKDGTTLKLSGDSLGTVTPTEVSLKSGSATATFTAGSTEGTSTITVKYDSNSKASASVKIDKTASTSTGSGSTSTSSTGDEFPYGVENIKWDNRGTNMKVGSWDVNAKINSAYHSGEKLYMSNNCSSVWKHRWDEGWSKPSVGNYWLIGKVNGEWHAATVDWAGVNKSGMNDLKLDGNSGMYSDLINWRPVKGEEAYVMMSTHARAYVDKSNLHRTQIVKITMNP